MGNVWLCIPSKRPPEQAEPVLRKWKDRGYKIALWLDEPIRWPFLAEVEYVQFGNYPGYATAVNRLAKTVIEDHEDAEWIVTGGDDVEPDPNHTADEIAAQCREHFDFHHNDPAYGVMQPTGDRWGADEPWAMQKYPDAPAYIDRICGSPWMGREFCLRANNGQGPLHPDFYHMFVDENLQEYAKHLGILWQRPDLTQKHNHWGRARGNPKDMPTFLEKACSPEHWNESKAIFERLVQTQWKGWLPK